MENIFSNVINWVKTHKLITVLILFVLYLLLKQNGTSAVYNSKYSNSLSMYDSAEIDMPVAGSYPNSGVSDMYKSRSAIMPAEPSAAPKPGITDRKVVTNSNLSIVVKNVRETINKISDEVKNKKGYVVNKYINTPEISETGTILIRVPSTEVDSFLNSVRNFSAKVINENISSDDITDSYFDVEERLKVLISNKQRFEEIMKEANNVDEILRVQQNIFSLQDQIDRLKGQLSYMDGTSTTSLITINMSTDEISLPYTPENPFRPQVIFKEAVRSLIIDLRWAATWLIWIAVYAAIWLPIGGLSLIGYSFYKRKFSQKIIK